MVENSTKAKKDPISSKQFILLFLACSILSYGIILIFNTPLAPSSFQHYLSGFGVAAIVMGLCVSLALITIYLACSSVICIVTRRDSSDTGILATGRWFGYMLLPLLAIMTYFPGYFGALGKALEAHQKGKAREIQLVVEAYAEKHHHYPLSIDDSFKKEFPNGTAPLNPFTQKNEWPIIGQLKDVEQARHQEPGPLAPGVIEYSPLLDSAGQINGYAIRVGAKNGKALRSFSGTLVLSNK